MTSYLEQVDQLQRRRARWPWLVAAAVVLVLATVGVTLWLAGGDTPAAGPAAASSPGVASPTASAMQYGSSMAACQGVDRLIKAGQLDNMDQVHAFADAAADSSDESVAFKARLLRQTAELAIAAKGQPDEAKYVEKTRTAAAEMQKACIKAGYA